MRAALIALPVVDVSHSPLGEPTLLDELEGHQLLCLCKHRKAAPEDHGVNEEPVVIDDVEFDKALRERCAAVRDDVFAVFAPRGAHPSRRADSSSCG